MGIEGNIEAIVAWADKVQSENNYMNRSLMEIYEGNLKKFVEDAMRCEFTTKAFGRSKHRIPPINVLKRTTDKLAKVYCETVVRTTTNPTDTELLAEYEDWFEIDDNLGYSDTLLNLLRSVAFEPYLDDDGLPQLRIIPPYQFTVYSDDPVNPNKPTVFIKFMGTRSIEPDGDDDYFRQINVYGLYDENRFMKVDSEMNVIEDSEHGLGRIPVEYMSTSKAQLVPDVDQDSFAMTVLVPMLLADLNYAVKYQAHGIRYGIDIDGDNLEGNPDSFWVVHSKEGENSKPSIGVIAPTVAIDAVRGLIKEEVTMWLESRSLKTGGSSGDTDTAMSGVAKVIDNVDVTDVRKENMKSFKRLESRLWTLTALRHNDWLESNQLNDAVTQVPFSENFVVSVKHGDMEPITDPAEKRTDLEFRLTQGLITKERAIREANPDLSQDEQDELIKELAIEESKKGDSVGRDIPNKEDEESEE